MESSETGEDSEPVLTQKPPKISWGSLPAAFQHQGAGDTQHNYGWQQ